MNGSAPLEDPVGRSSDPDRNRDRHKALIERADQAARNGDFATAEQILGTVALADTDPILWQKLAAARRARGDVAGAVEAIERALALRPRDAIALLIKGTLLEKLGHNAEESYAAALAFAGDPDRLPPPIRAQLAAAQRYGLAARAARAQALDRRLRDVLDKIDATAVDRARAGRFAAAIADGEAVLPLLTRMPIHDPDRFPNVRSVACAHAAFYNEYRQLMADASNASPYVSHPPGVPLDQWAELNGSERWNAAHLIRGGVVQSGNAAACPTTMAQYTTLPVPSVPGRSPNLMFSILAPHTHIPPHTGVSNARLVLHIPLVIPSDCSLTVGGECREWVIGTPILFDDTIVHEAVNGSDMTRVVLIGDVWHPDLSIVDRMILSRLMATP